MAKYWASVRAIYEYYTEEIEVENAEDARSQAYDTVKKLMDNNDSQLRPFGISIIEVGRMQEEKEG